MKTHPKQNCPACGKALPMWRILYDYDYTRVPIRKAVGKTPSYRKYAPFCTLRCALNYARALYERYGHMYKK